MKEIVILGDSHTRSFANINNIIPVFLGSGKVVNLSDYGTKVILESTRSLIKSLSNQYTFIMLLGEPNIRYQLKNDWNVHFTNFNKPDVVDTSYIDNCIKNYEYLINELGIISYIITPTTGYTPSLSAMTYFNRKLKETFGDIVIDIFTDTLVGESVADNYKSTNYNHDPIHLNSTISDVLLSKLKTKSNTFNIDNYNKLSSPFDCNDVRDIYKKSPFGTYTFKK